MFAVAQCVVRQAHHEEGALNLPSIRTESDIESGEERAAQKAVYFVAKRLSGNQKQMVFALNATQCWNRMHEHN